jgi:hypothetical protein
MKNFMFWVGWLYIAGGFLLFFPRLMENLGIRVPASVFWSEVAALLSLFLGMALVLSSRNLPARGAIAYWACWTLAVGGAMEITFGLARGLGVPLTIVGVCDLVVGLAFVVALPRHLGRSHGDLFLDRS